MSKRTKLGSAETRRLRKQGIVPGVLYGRSEPIPIAVNDRILRAALTTSSGSHVVLDLAIDEGAGHSAILKDYQRDKVRGTITHIDLQEVRLDVMIHASVSIELVGEAVGSKEGGIVSQVTNEVNVEALPLEVPQHLEIDISGLHVGDSLHLSDLAVPSGVTILDDLEGTVIATVTRPEREDLGESEDAAADADAETADAEAGAEGDDAEAAASGDGDSTEE